MARIRSVKPDLFASYTLAEVPVEARFLFIALFTEADDEGRLIDSPKRIAGAVFPHDEKITERHVQRWLDELERVGSIHRYGSGGGRYICLPNWEAHQKISHPTPSRLPSPSGEVPESLPPDLGKGKGRGGGGGSGTATAAPPIDEALPEDQRAWATNAGYGHLDLERQWARMLDHHAADGRRIANRAAAWRMWLGNEESQPTEVDKDRARCRSRRKQLETEIRNLRRAAEPDEDLIAEKLLELEGLPA